jgi:hypothetical protein
MPAVLLPEETERFLDGAMDRFSPAAHLLKVADAPNPLARNPNKPVQGELF